MFEVRIQPQSFDLAAEHARLAGHSPAIGAVVAFTGQVRGTPLELEHWPGMAERQMRHLLDEARARWPLAGAIVVHRFGRLEVGEPIVLVATASAHRAPAFAAAEFLMDWLKTRAPFWKREPDGSWVEARASDEAAAARWEQA